MKSLDLYEGGTYAFIFITAAYERNRQDRPQAGQVRVIYHDYT